MKPSFVVSVLCAIALGCSQLDMQLASDDDFSSTSLPRRTTDPNLRAERLARLLSEYEAEHSSAPEDYAIGAGDVLAVDVFALEKPDETASLQRVVSHGGQITLPWIGEVKVVGLSQWQVEQRIVAAYEDGYLKSPQVMVSVAEHRSAAVVLTGAVKHPGVVPLTANSSTVLEVLALVGGLAEDAGDELVLIRGRRSAEQAGLPAGTQQPAKVESIDLKQLLDEGNLTLNVPVYGGDILTVPLQTEEYIYVLGYVRHPGVYQIKGGMKVDALRAVALGGGLLPSARAEKSYLIRETRYGQKTVRLDLTQVGNREPPLYLEPGDTIVVGSSNVARLAEVIRPSMGLSASASMVP